VLDELGIAATTLRCAVPWPALRLPAAASGDLRAHLPRFKGDNHTANQQLAARLKETAAAKGISPAQLAIAWVLAKGPSLVPVVGSRTRAQIAEALGALNVKLTADEIAELEAAVPAEAVAGTVTTPCR